MAEIYSELNARFINFIKSQKIFCVATAPDNIEKEYVNLSPKGYDTLMILNNRTVVYADYPGSGNETATHIQQNGKLTMMFASLDETPMVLRLYGRGEVISLNSKAGKEIKEKMGEKVSSYIRQLICLHIEKVKTSCGYGVPYFKYLGERKTLIEWCNKMTLSPASN